MTQHDSLCLGLTHLGASPQAANRGSRAKGKYTIFRLGERYYFVGRAGALRVGFKASPSSSTPCHDVFRQRVLDAPAKALAAELAAEEALP